MNNLNSILIEGNVFKKPEMRTSAKGTNICILQMVSNRFFKAENGFEKELCFIDIETWGKLAENIFAKAKKGRGLRVIGRLKQERWNSVDGKPMTKISILAEHIELRPEFKKEKKNENSK